MTEHRWLETTEPLTMFEFLRADRGEARRKGGRRKLRLFACACLRGIWPLLRQPGSKLAVVVAEQFADGLAGNQELSQAYEAARTALASEYPEVGISPFWQSAEAATHVASRSFTFGNHCSVAHASSSACTACAFDWGQKGDRPRTRQLARMALHAEWLRDVFGNPFAPIAFDPAWRTPQVLALAATAYEERRFEDLPILADALEEAGCTDEAILSHLRGPGPHVRGCWVVDLILGRS